MKNKFTLYCYEALGLGIFMFSAGLFDVLIDHPALYIRQHISSDLLRRFLIGLAMGGTALYIFTAPFGKKSGAHINPCVTFVQYKLGNIQIQDALFYVLFQFVGGSFGMYLIYKIMPTLVAHSSINYIITKPGKQGIIVAFIAEFLASCTLILTVLFTLNHVTLKKYTNYFVASLITLFVTFEAPLSGFSINPARTFSSAIVANQWGSFWLYCTAPFLGMWAGQIFYSYINERKQNI